MQEPIKKCFLIDWSKPLLLCRYTVSDSCADLADESDPRWEVPAALTLDFLFWLAGSPWSSTFDMLQGIAQLNTGEPLLSMWVEEDVLDAFLKAAIARYPEVPAFREMAVTSSAWRAQGHRQLDISGYEFVPIPRGSWSSRWRSPSRRLAVLVGRRHLSIASQDFLFTHMIGNTNA